MNPKQMKNIVIEEFIRIVEMSLLDKAEEIAQMAHLHQKRIMTPGMPYIIHPKRVQLLAKALGYGIDVQIIALLHDVIENSDNPKYYYDMIQSKFNSKILNAILLLSHDKNITYNQYLETLAKSESVVAKLAFKVKMLDMLDNLTDLPKPEQMVKYKNAILNLISLGYESVIPKRILKVLDIEDEVLQEAPKDNKKQPKDTTNNELDTPPDKGNDTSPGDQADAQDASPPPGLDSPGAGGGDGDIFGNEPAADVGGDMGGPGGAPDAGADEKNSIVHYNDKLQKMKIIDMQKKDAEPGFNFQHDNKFYRENYIAQSSGGSTLIAIPSKLQNNFDREFIIKSVLPKLIKVTYEAMKSGKDVVLMGDYGLPYYDGKYSNSPVGLIAKLLNEKFKGSIKFDTWNPKDYYSFVSNTELWKDLKVRTEAENAELKSALYLFLLATGKDRDVVHKLKTDNVKDTLSKWGLPDELSVQTNKEDIYRVIFPDMYNSAETLASYIIKTYLQLLRVYMLRKVIQYEKQGSVVIIPTDANTSWMLNTSFKNLDKIQKSKKEPAEASSEPEPEMKSPENTQEK